MTPIKNAAGLAVAYVVLAGTWILVSDHVATLLTSNREELSRFERIKGLGFVLVTGGLLFCGAWLMFRRLIRQHHRLLQQRTALLEAERRAAGGTMAAALAHDCRNLLMVISANAQLLGDHLGDNPEAERVFRDLHLGIDRLVGLALRLREAGGTPSEQRTEVELTSLVEDQVRLLRPHALLRAADLRVLATGPLPAAVYVTCIRQVLLNLILNGAEAGARRVEVRVHRLPGDEAALEVHDDGPGIPPELRGRVLEPQFTTKPEGTGLGLFSVDACVRAHGARLAIGRSDLGGASLSFRLPLLPEAAPSGRPLSSRSAAAKIA